MTYGVIHDEITAHLCVEYFTVAHPNLFPTRSETLLGLAWGITGTFWLGLLLGAVLARVCTYGKRVVSRKFLLKRICLIIITSALTAFLAAMVVYQFALRSHLLLPDPNVPVAKHALFYAVWAAHLGSYVASIVASLAVILNVASINIVGAAASEPEKD